MKSDSGSEQRANKWRLHRTVRRNPDYRPIEDEDIRYAWACYRQSGMRGFPEGLAADSFKTEFEKFVTSRYQAAWTLTAPTKRGSIPVGFVFGSWSPTGTHIIVDGAIWFPWSSSRNIIEAMVLFLSSVRHQYHLQFFALPEHKRLYEVCAMHGIVRRVGTSYVVIPGKPAAVFETRLKAN